MLQACFLGKTSDDKALRFFGVIKKWDTTPRRVVILEMKEYKKYIDAFEKIKNHIRTVEVKQKILMEERERLSVLLEELEKFKIDENSSEQEIKDIEALIAANESTSKAPKISQSIQKSSQPAHNEAGRRIVMTEPRKEIVS